MILRSDDDTPETPAPLAARGRGPGYSVARIPDDWYVACRSRDLNDKRPFPLTIFGIPLVVYRGPGGRPAAVLDRCPHRNAPLSLGRVVGGKLECGYHGWQFEPDGQCSKVPGLQGEPSGKARCVDAFPCREQDGFVWVYPTPNAEPERGPYSIPFLGEPGYTTVYQTVEAEGSLHAVAENALDVPHTAFLHRGLFRGAGEPNELMVEVRRYGDRVEAEYLGEPRPSGLAGRILAPGSSQTVDHVDRFILPCVAQVEYRMGEKSHFCVTTLMTPLEEFKTRLFAVISFRLPFAGWLVAPLLAPIAKRIFAQDATVLARQTETVKRFGGEQYASTEIDILGQHILSLLRKAERGDRSALPEPIVKRFPMMV